MGVCFLLRESFWSFPVTEKALQDPESYGISGSLEEGGVRYGNISS